MGDNNYYDRWGGRAYVFSEDYAYNNINLKNNQTHSELLINVEALKNLEGKYVFSRFVLSNNKELGLNFIGTFTDEKSPYIIHMYRLNF